jgi:hypothetical protein
MLYLKHLYELQYSMKYKVKSKAVQLHTMQALRGEEYSSYLILLTSTLVGASGQRHALAALYSRERTPSTHWIGVWAGPRAVLDTETRGETLLPLPRIVPRLTEETCYTMQFTFCQQYFRMNVRPIRQSNSPIPRALQAHVLDLFDERRRWILLGNVTRAQGVLEDLSVLIHSNVVVADRVSEGSVLLLELYKRRSHETLMKTVIGDWDQKRGVRLTSSPITFPRRANLQKSILKAVMVVRERHTSPLQRSTG